MGREARYLMTMTLADAARIDDGAVTPRTDRPKRRTFTAEYEASVLAEYDAADRGNGGAILRREGLYSSHIVEKAEAELVKTKAARQPPPQAPKLPRPPGSTGPHRRPSYIPYGRAMHFVPPEVHP
jgi:hypothetical protein